MEKSEQAESKVVVYFGANQIEREISADERCYIVHNGGFFLDRLSITQNGDTREYSTPNVANIFTCLFFILVSIFSTMFWFGAFFIIKL